MNQIRLHEQERPLGLLMSMKANLERDSKRRPKPYTPEDFYIYQPIEDRNLPDGRYGAAAVELAKQKLLPPWALFCFKELLSVSNGPAPVILAFISEEAILIGPEKTSNGYKGLLIATESASNQIVRAHSPCGMSVTMLIPPVSTKFEAREVSELRCW